MRTGGQGQAAALRERADRRRDPLPAWTGDPGPSGEDPADCHRFVERYPEAFPAGADGAGGVFGLPWARSAFMAFCLRKFGPCGPGSSQMEGNEK